MTGRDFDSDETSDFRFLEPKDLAIVASSYASTLMGVAYSEQLLWIRERLAGTLGARRSLMSFAEAGPEQLHHEPRMSSWLLKVSAHNEEVAGSIFERWTVARSALAEYEDRVEFRVTGWIEDSGQNVSIEPDEVQRFYALIAARRQAEVFTRDVDWEHNRIWQTIGRMLSNGLDWDAIENELVR